MADKKKSAITFVQMRSKIFEGPPATLGWFDFLEPDVYEGNSKFKGNFHFGDAQQAALKNRIETEVIAPLWDKFLAAEEENGRDPNKLKRPNADNWVDDHLKTPSEKSKCQNPYMTFSVKSDWTDRDGNVHRREIKAWGPKGELLDLRSLQMWRGSIVTPMLTPGLFKNALIKPSPNFQLVGVRVLKLERGGTQEQSVGAVDDSELAALGEDFEVEDLGAYVAGMNKGPAKGEFQEDAREYGHESAYQGGGDFAEDEDIPF